MSSLGFSLYDAFREFMFEASRRFGRKRLWALALGDVDNMAVNALQHNGFKVSMGFQKFTRASRGKYFASFLREARYMDLVFHVLSEVVDYIGDIRIIPTAYRLTVIYVGRREGSLLKRILNLFSSLKPVKYIPDTLAVDLTCFDPEYAGSCPLRCCNTCYTLKLMRVGYTSYDIFDGSERSVGIDLEVKEERVITLEDLKDTLNDLERQAVDST